MPKRDVNHGLNPHPGQIGNRRLFGLDGAKLGGIMGRLGTETENVQTKNGKFVTAFCFRGLQFKGNKLDVFYTFNKDGRIFLQQARFSERAEKPSFDPGWMSNLLYTLTGELKTEIWDFLKERGHEVAGKDYKRLLRRRKGPREKKPATDMVAFFNRTGNENIRKKLGENGHQVFEISGFEGGRPIKSFRAEKDILIDGKTYGISLYYTVEEKGVFIPRITFSETDRPYIVTKSQLQELREEIFREIIRPLFTASGQP